MKDKIIIFATLLMLTSLVFSGTLFLATNNIGKAIIDGPSPENIDTLKQAYISLSKIAKCSMLVFIIAAGYLAVKFYKINNK